MIATKYSQTHTHMLPYSTHTDRGYTANPLLFIGTTWLVLSLFLLAIVIGLTGNTFKESVQALRGTEAQYRGRAYRGGTSKTIKSAQNPPVRLEAAR